MKRLFLACALAALASAPAAAQEKQQPAAAEAARPQAVKVFEIKHGNLQRIASALATVGARVNTTPDLNLLTVRADKELMPALEEVVRRMDVPSAGPTNVEVTLYLLQASIQPVANTITPPDLEPALKQLRSAFAYQGFRLLDTMLIRNRIGERADVTGILAFGKDETSPYQLRFIPNTAPGDKNSVIRLNNLFMETSVNLGPGRSYAVRISGDVDIREGQKVVVGKTGIEGADRALILVVSARTVE